MEKENQRIALTKRLLKESMLRLLKERELDKINVTQLCREAGINRATFYRHYEIPRDVLIEIEKDLYHDLKRIMGIPKTPEEIQPIIEKLCSYMEQNIDILRIIITSNTDMDFALFVNGIYAEILSEIRKAGMLKDLNDEDIKLLSLYCAGGSYFILRQWLLGNIPKSAKQMASYVSALLNKTDWGTRNSQLGLVSIK